MKTYRAAAVASSREPIIIKRTAGNTNHRINDNRYQPVGKFLTFSRRGIRNFGVERFNLETIFKT